MHESSRRGTVSAAMLLAIGLVLVSAPAAVAKGGFSAPITLRTGPPGARVSLDDIATAGDDVSVVWSERTGGESAIRLRTSANGGWSFRPQRLVEERHGSGASTDVCGGYAWVAHSFRAAGDPEGTNGLMVRGLAMTGTGRTRERVVPSGTSPGVSGADFACVGSRRRAVTWVSSDSDSTSTVHVRFLPGHAGVGRDVPPAFTASLGADASTSIAIAATRTHAWLAWVTKSERIRIKRFDVGLAPDFAVTPRPAVTLPDAAPNGWAVLGASGRRVVVGYRTVNSTHARVSTDAGVTFGPRRTLIDFDDFADVFTGVSSADIRGGRAVVHAESAGLGDDGFDLSTQRFVSRDGGRSWRGVTLAGDGQGKGAFTIVRGEPRLVEAWDHSASATGRQWIRFHRQL